jgi:5'-nucleotidase
VDRPIRVAKYEFSGPSTPGWVVDGTPTDCVKLAVCSILAEPPDLVVSGINRGGNLGTDVMYSGTVAAAIEAIILGVPSIAISLNSFEYQADYTYAAKIARTLCQEIAGVGIPAGAMLNVNVPSVPESEIRGIKLTKLGIRRYEDVFSERKDPRGKSYYWLAGDIVDDDQDEDTDVMAIRDNFVTMTPVHFDLTNFCLKEYLQSRLQKILRQK